MEHSQTDYASRARKIVDRVMPVQKTPSAFLDPNGFIAATQYTGERNRLYHRTFARLRAKAEGGVPYIKLPAETFAIEGGPMWQVAHELENEARAAESYIPAGMAA